MLAERGKKIPGVVSVDLSTLKQTGEVVNPNWVYWTVPGASDYRQQSGLGQGGKHQGCHPDSLGVHSPYASQVCPLKILARPPR